MSETGEGGVAGFWKKITGQAAREAAARQAEALVNQRKQEEIKARVAQSAKRLRIQINDVVDVKRIQAPDLKGDIQSTVEELEKQVTARSIFGKFPPEVRIKERVFHHDNTGDFTEYGDEEAGGFMGDKKVHISVLGIIYDLLHERRSQSPAFQELAKKHFLMAVNIPETQDAILSYQFLQNWKDGSGRAASVVAMNFRLKRESAYKLLDLVRENPEAAEMFLQKAADGFEAGDPNLPKVGIPRVRSEEIVILNLDKFNPDYFNRYIYTDPRIIAQEIVQNQTEIYRYSKPHGIADPNQIPL